MLNIKKVALSCALLIGLNAGSAQAQDCGEVSITEMDWGSAVIVTQVAKFLLEQGYGCSVTVVPSASTPALASVSETGEPDIITEVWTNGAPAYVPLLEAGKINELTRVLSDGGLEGLFIPVYLAEAHPELTTIEGVLANPDLVGNRMHNCPVGWNCQTVATNVAKGGVLQQLVLKISCMDRVKLLPLQLVRRTLRKNLGLDTTGHLVWSSRNNQLFK